MVGSASSPPQSTASPGSTAKASSAAPTATSGGSNSQNPTGSAKPSDATDSAAPTGGGHANKTDSTAASTTAEPDARDPPGGVVMLTPASATTTYYKIGEDVTLAWNYTDLQVTPSAVDVVASNTAGAWTLTANASVQATGRVVWRTKDDEGGANPLLTDTYTLVIYDTKAGVTGAPKAGYLALTKNFQFGMYLPQPYTPLSGKSLVAKVICMGQFD